MTQPNSASPPTNMIAVSGPPATRKKTRLGLGGRMVGKLFPHAVVFSTQGGKFSPLPWILRRVQWLFTPRGWQVLSYLMLRVGPEGVTWISDQEIAVDLDVGYRKIGPQIKKLKELGFVDVKNFEGRRYTIVLDPLTALRALVKNGTIANEKLERLEFDCEAIGLELFPAGLVAADNGVAAQKNEGSAQTEPS